MNKHNYSPLRYPGGKAKIYQQISEVIEDNNLVGCHYIEPYVGGAGLALSLLFNKKVSHIHINDLDPAIYSFWYSVCYHTDILMELIQKTEITIQERDRQKIIYQNYKDYTVWEVGFATLFLNRTNISGILKGGPIGGNNQSGQYKLNCRFNKKALIEKIRNIASYRDFIHLSNKDAIDFLRDCENIQNPLLYLDPPYVNKANNLYTNFYSAEDHKKIAQVIHKYADKYWFMTYDNVPLIRELYQGYPQKELEFYYSASLKIKKLAKELFIYNKLQVLNFKK